MQEACSDSATVKWLGGNIINASPIADSLPFFKHWRTVSYGLEDIARHILAGRVR